MKREKDKKRKSEKGLSPTFLCTPASPQHQRKNKKEKKRRIREKEIKRKREGKKGKREKEKRRKSEKGLTPTFLCTQASNPYLDISTPSRMMMIKKCSANFFKLRS